MNRLKKAAKRTGARPALIRWLDSSGPDGWVFSSDFSPHIVPIDSLGWIVAEKKKEITLTSSVGPSGDQQWHGPITIPRCSIKRITYLGGK